LPLGQIGHLADAHRYAHDHQQAYRIIITIAATACNIQLIVNMIIASYTCIAYHVWTALPSN